MKLNKILLVSISLLILLISISSVVAIDSNDNNISSTAEDSDININHMPIEDLENNDNFEDNNLLSSNDGELVSGGNVIIVEDEGDNHNEMTQPTIQKAINSANSGDTIIIQGKSYVHCHFIVDKKLTIISNVNTVMTPCSSKATSNHQGIFYFTSKASGSVLEGFSLSDDGMFSENEAYGVLIAGASDITIRNCKISTGDAADSIRLENAKNCFIQNVTAYNSINGINVKNSEGISIKNSTFRNNGYGINIVGSTDSLISGNDVFSNNIAGISIGQNCRDTTITSNNLTNNKYSGVNLSSAEYVDILNNYIAVNRFGVYVNCNITQINIKGNFFNKNSVYEIYNDYRVRNLVDKSNPREWIAHEDLEVIDNNYMIGLNERPVYTNSFVFAGKNMGDYSYNSQEDTYTYVGSGNGDYINQKSVSFLRYLFEINEYVECPSIFFKYPEYWYTGDYELKLTEISQTKKGVYSISIVDANGNVAKELSSIYVTFFLNKNNTKPTPSEGDVYKTVQMINGTATVRFTSDEFKESDNSVCVFLPGASAEFLHKTYRKLDIDDSDIPGEVLDTKLSISSLTTYPGSGEYLIVTLKDANGKAIEGQLITIRIFSRDYHAKTNDKGQAKLKIVQPQEGTYQVSAKYDGEDGEYAASSAKSNVVVKRLTSTIQSSNVNMIPNMAEKYEITLKDTNGKAIVGVDVVFSVNGKRYSVKTDNAGKASVNLKFSAEKSYKISISFSGNYRYKPVSKTNTITVKYSSKTAKLTVPTVSMLPKTSNSYVVTLKDGNAKGIAKQSVTIKVDGKTYTKTTDNNGQVSINVKFNDLKTYKVTANYNGNSIYQKASATGSIKVDKIATKVVASNMLVTPNTKTNFVVSLKTSSGTPIAKQKVLFHVVGRTYTSTTNEKGEAFIYVCLNVEKNYPITIEFKGNDNYKVSKVSKTITIQKTDSNIISNDRTFSINSKDRFSVTLKDSSGNILQNQNITFTFNGKSLINKTDANGIAEITIDSDNVASYDIVSKFEGNDQCRPISKTNKITVLNKTGIIFVDPNLSSSEIQKILDDAPEGSNIEFLGDSYSDISVIIKKSANVYSSDGTTLNGKNNVSVFTISADDVNISTFSIISNSGSGIAINNAENVNIFNNFISNKLDDSKAKDYMESTISLPGYGVSTSNSTAIQIYNNSIELFESGIFSEYSSSLDIKNNTLKENNYGIKYGFGVSDSVIYENNITESIGLYTFEVPEGPRGYGIFLNNSAVNVKINKNIIDWNHMGISVDSNHSTGIEITGNYISDNVLEGIRFNAGYDLAFNAVEPIVTDNAIYRNARGPSMMILGELSANPEGIYGPGQWNDSLKLKIGPNWYGKNAIVTWDYETGVVGYGTMCPRINTTPIAFNEIECISPGSFSVTFYKNGEIASDLAEFDLFATLNNKTEVNFKVVNGVGKFNFDSSAFDDSGNVIGISSGSINDESRNYDYFYTYNVSENEF